MLPILLITVGIFWCLRSWRINQGKCFMFHDWYVVDSYSQYYDSYGGYSGWCGENRICRRCEKKQNGIPAAQKNVADEKKINEELEKLAM